MSSPQVVAARRFAVYDSWPIPAVKLMRSAGPLVERLPRPLFRAQLSLLIHQGHDDRDRAREATQVHWRGYDHSCGAAVLLRQMRSLDNRDTLAVAAEHALVLYAIEPSTTAQFIRHGAGRHLTARRSGSSNPRSRRRWPLPERSPRGSIPSRGLSCWRRRCCVPADAGG